MCSVPITEDSSYSLVTQVRQYEDNLSQLSVSVDTGPLIDALPNVSWHPGTDSFWSLFSPGT